LCFKGHKNKFLAEMIQTAIKLSTFGKGILAADESTGTITKRFNMIDVECNEENRRRYRELLFKTPGLQNYISGVILYEETTLQKTHNGKNLVELLLNRGIVPGIKVDKGQ